MRVSLIIPVYNEKRHLARFLKTIDDLQLNCDKELVFVDDKSNDGSTDILKTYDFQSRVLLSFQEKNQGKSAALAVGIKQATGDVIGIQDADFEYDMEDIEKLINLNKKIPEVIDEFKQSHDVYINKQHEIVERL